MRFIQARSAKGRRRIIAIAHPLTLCSVTNGQQLPLSLDMILPRAMRSLKYAILKSCTRRPLLLHRSLERCMRELTFSLLRLLTTVRSQRCVSTSLSRLATRIYSRRAHPYPPFVAARTSDPQRGAISSLLTRMHSSRPHFWPFTQRLLLV